jgi:hypothetical protein
MLVSSIKRRITNEFGTIEEIKARPTLSLFLEEYSQKHTYNG